MSLFAMLGGAGNILDLKPERAQFIHLPSPVLSNAELSKIKQIVHPNFKSGVIDTVFKADGQQGRLQAAIDHVCAVAEDLARNGVNILILSDRNADPYRAPIPSLMAVGAVHHHLIRKGLRSLTSIVVESGDVRETHHFATLIGYGASAINPYMAYATIAGLKKRNVFDKSAKLDKLFETYNKAVGKGLLKIMSKIGISTLQSYQGAQIFEVLGLNEEVVDKCFRGSISRIQGIGFDGIAREVLARHRLAFPEKALANGQLDVGGVYQWKRRGEAHTLTPQTIHLLQYATRKNDYSAFKKYAKLINEQTEQALTLRGLLTFRKGERIDIKEVEPAERIMKRFATGAMSFGSISHEAHSTLAVAMNRIGAKSNSGEGGEDESRFEPKPNGDWQRSAIKQVASGRFGVTSYYLANAAELQIKMAQGAKPGEGGQLPGHKVDDWIGRVRHSTPGVGLISPPPHHDIYSIEDLAQLIFDLKNANPAARINVKLVSKAGVGIIASGVAKAHADAILISGHDGGTGASPLTSIRHAGLPWELGLAESHQTLVKNKLRDRVVLQTDGQIRTGRDLAIATLLGAEEWGVATAALIVEGCIMMRKCHLNTCPVGVATQDPELRKKFSGQPEHVVNFFFFIAEEVRELMAQLGIKKFNDLIGRADLLNMKKGIEHWKARGLDYSRIFHLPDVPAKVSRRHTETQDHGLDKALDNELIRLAEPALERGERVSIDLPVRNINRTVGASLSGAVARKYGHQGLPEDTIHIRLTGTAGQSFGAFLSRGVSLELVGEGNDYVGKGLSGGRIVVRPQAEFRGVTCENIIVGNTVMYGATEGESFFAGVGGERFCVRNSGGTAVVEGVGDHGCEYMTGGTVVVLGQTGRNFAAGMSGGVAYVLDEAGDFEQRCNMAQVALEPVPEEIEARKGSESGDELESHGRVEIDHLEMADEYILKSLIERHVRFTESPRGREILDNWASYRGRFVKVMPNEYRRVLAEMAEQKQKQLEAA